MDALPDELVLHILDLLDNRDLVTCRELSTRFSRLAADSGLWKVRCFDGSATRRAQDIARTNQRLSALRQAVEALDAGKDDGPSHPRHVNDTPSRIRARALASWDPVYPGEHLDFYQEYIHRHAPVAPIAWLLRDQCRGPRLGDEVTGIGVLRDDSDHASHIFTARADASICAWGIDSDQPATSPYSITTTACSRAGLLSDLTAPDRSKATEHGTNIMTETGTVECVSIDSQRKRGYFAVQSSLREVDLETLAVLSSSDYSFPISALSEVSPTRPLVVGTASTVHIYDARSSHQNHVAAPNCEQIAGPSTSHAILTQPGPLSIAHAPESSLWVAGRFTHLLNYDTRFFPRLLNTLYSGARISSISLLPFPYIPRHLTPSSNPNTSLSAYQSLKSSPGSTLLAAGVYKGKGSLELHGLPPPAPQYHNRQTAAPSKLLSAIPHAAALVASDSDGNVHWFERDAHHRVRTANINIPTAPSAGNSIQSLAREQLPHLRSDRPSDWADLPGEGDIVQKIVSVRGGAGGNGRQDPLLLWTGDGRVGVLGFGRRSPVVQRWSEGEGEGDLDAEGRVADGEELEVLAKRAELRAREDAERQYAGSLRRALEGQASEARFMRGLGVGGRYEMPR